MTIRLLRVLVLVLAAILIGCGGGGGEGAASSARKGSASIKIVWPAASRLIPLATTKIRLHVTPPAGVPAITDRVVDAPEPSDPRETEEVYDRLIPGQYSVTAEAFNGAPDTSPELAGGEATFNVDPERNSDFTITMDSAVSRFKVVFDPAGPPPAQTFYLSSRGATSDQAGLAPTVPTFNLIDLSWDVSITAQGTGPSDLLLTPPSNVSPLALTVGSPLTATIQPSNDGKTQRYQLSLSSFSEGSSRFQVVYAEDPRISFATQILVQASTASGASAQATSLPKMRRDNLVNLHAVLEEVSGNDKQHFETDTLVERNRSSVDILGFTEAIDRGIAFKLTVTLQVRTSDDTPDGQEQGGFVNVARATDQGLLRDSGGNVNAFRADFSGKFNEGGFRHVEVVGNQNIVLRRGGPAFDLTTVRTKVGVTSSSIVTVDLPAEMFTFPPTDGQNDNAIALTYVPPAATPGAWRFTPPAGGSGSTTNDFEPFFGYRESAGDLLISAGLLNYSVSTNSGGIVVGVG